MIVIRDNPHDVRTIIMARNFSGEDIEGVEEKSVDMVAKDIVVRHEAAAGQLKFRLLTKDESVRILYNIVKEDAGKTELIRPRSLTMATVRALYEDLSEIRLGKHTDLLEKDAGVEGSKISKLLKIIEEYEKYLRENKMWDRPLVVNAAVEILRGGEAAPVSEKYACLEETRDNMTYREKELMSLVAPDMEIWEYDKSVDADTVKAELYTSYGRVNEVQNIVETIVDRKLPLGDVCVTYTSEEYENIIEATFAAQNIPVRFVSKRSFAGNDVIELFLSILEWARGNYEYRLLKPVLKNEAVERRKNFVGSGKYDFGNEIGIGWGLGDYAKLSQLLDPDKRAALLDRKAEFNSYSGFKSGKIRDDDNKQWEYFGESVLALADVFAKAQYGSTVCELAGASEVPARAASVDVSELYNGILEWIDSFVHFRKEGEETEKNKRGNEIAGSNCLRDEKAYMSFAGQACDMAEAFDIMEERITSLAVSEGENSDAVTVCTFGTYGRAFRKYQFIVGMSFDSFAEKSVESPFLDDAEKEKYLDVTAGKINLAKNKDSEKRDSLRRYVWSMKDTNLVVSAPVYDTVEGRDLTRDTMFDEIAACFGIGEADVKSIDEYFKISKGNFKFGSDTLPAEKQLADDFIYSHVKFYSEKTEENPNPRISESVADDGHRIVTVRLSPTRMGSLLKCPLSFLYGIQYYPEDPRGMDSVIWLKANEKGTLFHGTMEEYCNTYLKERHGDISAFDADSEAKLREIFEQKFAVVKEFIPTGSQWAMNREKNENYEIIKSYAEFLQNELSASSNKWIVKECERAFEFEYGPFNKDGKPYKDGDGDALVIKFEGSLDRIDEYEEDGKRYIRIIDYKTGRPAPKKVTEFNLYNQQCVVYPLSEVKKFEDDIASIDFKYEFVEGYASDANFYDDNLIGCFDHKYGAEGTKLSDQLNLRETDIQEIFAVCVDRDFSYRKGEYLHILETNPDLFPINDTGGLMYKVEDLLKDKCKYCDFKSICAEKMEFVSNAEAKEEQGGTEK